MSKEKEYFIENLSMLLGSGMGVAEAVDSLMAELKPGKIKQMLEKFRYEIDNGSPVWLSLQKAGLAPVHVVSLIKVGEEAGRLSENLKIVSTEQQKERIFKSKIKSALMYPIMVLVLTLVIGIGIAWFILPRLATVFSQLKLDLPFITQALIALGEFLEQYGHIAVPAFICFFAATFYFIFMFKRTKRAGEYIILHLPLIKRLVRDAELSRFGYIMGTLVNAGLNINQALSSLSDVSKFVNYRKLYVYLRVSIEDGNSFKKSFELYKGINELIPIHVQGMIVAGEKSGNLADVFLKFGVIYEEKTDVTAKNLTVLLEPILLVIVWLGVVGVALAIILPIYSLIGGLN